MSLYFDVSINCNCSGCGMSLDEGDDLYCEDCFNGESDDMAEPEDDMAHCSCGAYVPISRMIEKIGGLKCRKCARKYEETLLAENAVTKPINGQPTEGAESAGNV